MPLVRLVEMHLIHWFSISINHLDIRLNAKVIFPSFARERDSCSASTPWKLNYAGCCGTLMCHKCIMF